MRRLVNRRLAPWLGENPFTVTAFSTAMEMAAGHATLCPTAASVALLAILNETEPDALDAELERLLEAGYSTIKVKVGWNVQDDLHRVRHIQQALRGRARIRIDANQGYSKDDGCSFARSLDPAGIELFEQACAAGDWDAALAVKRAATVPIMLDESIYTMADVEKAAALGAADIIKLKLMKLGSIDAARTGAGPDRRARHDGGAGERRRHGNRLLDGGVRRRQAVGDGRRDERVPEAAQRIADRAASASSAAACCWIRRPGRGSTPRPSPPRASRARSSTFRPVSA